MKTLKPRTFSFLSSFMIVVMVAIFIIIYITFQKQSTIIFTGGLLIIFISTYFIYRYYLNRFIYNRIKLIYKTIHILKSPKQEMGLFQEQDLLEDTEEKIIKWAEEKKNEMDQLQRSETYRREFVGNVSHELKTPIFNIQGYITTLIDGGINDPEINLKYLERAEKNINRMIAIVQDLEIISQLESGQLQLNLEQFDLVQIVKEVMDGLEIKALKKQITLTIQNDVSDVIPVKADRNRIKQVLSNLIENSIKYNNDHGRTAIKFFDMDVNILVEVTDNGIGIPVEHLPRIFERFYRVDKGRSREQGGSGLGLAIVKHIIEAHLQTINVRSTAGVGTTFAFTIKKA